MKHRFHLLGVTLAAVLMIFGCHQKAPSTASSGKSYRGYVSDLVADGRSKDKVAVVVTLLDTGPDGQTKVVYISDAAAGRYPEKGTYLTVSIAPDGTVHPK